MNLVQRVMVMLAVSSLAVKRVIWYLNFRDCVSDSDSDNDSIKWTSLSQQAKDIHFAISYFILFLQMCYHLSDRGVKLVLQLLWSLFCWLSTVFINNKLITEIVSGFPKSNLLCTEDLNSNCCTCGLNYSIVSKKV